MRLIVGLVVAVWLGMIAMAAYWTFGRSINLALIVARSDGTHDYRLYIGSNEFLEMPASAGIHWGLVRVTQDAELELFCFLGGRSTFPSYFTPGWSYLILADVRECRFESAVYYSFP